MPTYDYRCEACGHEFDVMQGIKESPLRKCPKCKKPRLRRLIGTGGGLIFKGSGFYITDYRSESYKDKAKQDAKPESAPATDSTAPKAEKAPAAAKSDKPASSKSTGSRKKPAS